MHTAPKSRAEGPGHTLRGVIFPTCILRSDGPEEWLFGKAKHEFLYSYIVYLGI